MLLQCPKILNVPFDGLHHAISIELVNFIKQVKMLLFGGFEMLLCILPDGHGQQGYSW